MKQKIIGPPGAGKTTRLMDLLEMEIKNGVRPDKIGFLTFTRAAREEALGRTGKTQEEFQYLRTIHSICYRSLEITNTHLVKPPDLHGFSKRIGSKLNGVIIDPWIEEFERPFETPTRDDIILQISHCGRHKGIPLKEIFKDCSFEVDLKYALWLNDCYRSWKKAEGYMDYTDLLTEYIFKGKPLEIDLLFVDEAQDLSRLQWEVVEKLGAKANKWYVAGDDDQAIFQWAGADSEVFQSLRTEDISFLEQSYRLPKSIHDVAMKIAGRIRHRIQKKYNPRDIKGEVIDTGFLQSCDFKEKTFLLFRNHFRGQELAKQLKDEFIPYIGHGSPLINADVRLAMKAWYSLFKNGEISSIGARKIVKYADQGYLPFDIADRLNTGLPFKLNELFLRIPRPHDWRIVMKNIPGLQYLEVCVQKNSFIGTANPKVELLSIHQSKGREAHTVILDSETSRAVYESTLSDPDSEHRVWYVGVTRAKERLYTLMPWGAYSYKF